MGKRKMKYEKLEKIEQIANLKVGDIFPMRNLKAYIRGDLIGMIEEKDKNSMVVFTKHPMGDYLRYFIEDVIKQGIITPNKEYGFNGGPDNEKIIMDPVIKGEWDASIEKYNEAIKK